MSRSNASTPHTRTRLATLGLAALLAAGCGSVPGGAGRATEPVKEAGPLVRVLYVWEPTGGDCCGRVELVVFAQGSDRSRTELALYVDGPEPDETMVSVRDGNRALFFNDQAEPPYTLMEAADEHPDEFFVQEVPLDPASEAFRDVCPDAEPAGPRTILGRPAVGHTCTWEDPEPDVAQASSIWLDEATGMILELGYIKAREIDDAPDVDASTFSTTPPAGAKVEVVKATGKGPSAP